MTRTVSPAGRAALMTREGCRLTAYRDSVGIPTIGVGHTGRASPPAVTMGMSITLAEADRIFAQDLAPFEAAVAGAVPGRLTQNQFDALVSLAFNIGTRGFMGSSVVHKLADGDATGAADAFLLWAHPAELASRRRAERAQFLRPDDPPRPAAPAPVALPVPQPGLWARIVATLTRKAA